MKQDKKIRILLAKAGCDIHERGVLTLLNVFRDAGMDVIYSGRYQTEEAIAKTAVEEDVSIIALSDLTGSLPIIARKVIDALKKLDAEDIMVIAGGLLTEEDAKVMKALGVKASFATGSPTDPVVECIRKLTSGI
jgi:methylmalonyl-CoA mutase C-terminal domain/subunit